MKKIVVISVILYALYIYIAHIEPEWVEWKNIDIPIKNLPKNLDSKILLQISDIHIGDRVDKEFIKDIFTKVDALHPDIIVYTGDFIRLVDNEVPWDDLDAILKVAPKGKVGTIAILGNHDYGKNFQEAEVADSISFLLQKHGLTVLRNSETTIAGLKFIGIDDYYGTNFQPQTVLKNNNSDPTIVLCHNPDVADLDVWNGYKGWIISGHTHAGQIRIPFYGSPILPVKNKNYDQGIKHLTDGRTLYINRGLGHSIKIRFNARPEVTSFRLVNKTN